MDTLHDEAMRLARKSARRNKHMLATVLDFLLLSVINGAGLYFLSYARLGDRLASIALGVLMAAIAVLGGLAFREARIQRRAEKLLGQLRERHFLLHALLLTRWRFELLARRLLPEGKPFITMQLPPDDELVPGAIVQCLQECKKRGFKSAYLVATCKIPEHTRAFARELAGENLLLVDAQELLRRARNAKALAPESESMAYAVRELKSQFAGKKRINPFAPELMGKYGVCALLLTAASPFTPLRGYYISAAVFCAALALVCALRNPHLMVYFKKIRGFS